MLITLASNSLIEQSLLIVGQHGCTIAKKGVANMTITNRPALHVFCSSIELQLGGYVCTMSTYILHSLFKFIAHPL